MSIQYTSGRFHAEDAAGLPLIGAQLYTYAAGTSTPQATYTDYTLGTPNTNPVVLNARGEASVWLGTNAYKFILKDALGNTVWTDDGVVDPGVAPSTALATFIANLASSIGGTLVSFVAAGSSYLRTLAAWINDTPNVKNFGALGNGIANDTAAFNAAAAYVRSIGGDTLFIPRGTFNLDDVGYVYDGVSLLGTGKLTTTLAKNTTTTRAVTVTAGPLVVYNGASLPSDINAVLVLDGPGGRYRGSIRNLRVLGGLTTAGQPETAKVEFGIVQLGTESDFVLDNVQVENVNYSVLLPDVFAAEISNCRWESCLKGPAIDSGTSLEFHSNYANNCRDWGRYFRNISYTNSSGNACDSLNAPALYPDRTRLCVANKLRSLLSFTSTSDGCEQPYGIVWELDTLDNCVIDRPTVYGFGSDYAGTGEMAVVYIKGAARDVKVTNLRGVGLKASGLLSGGAVDLAAHHHDVYVEPSTVFTSSVVSGVLLTTTLSSRVPAGYGNNVPTNWPNVGASNSLTYSSLGTGTTYAPTLQAQTSNDVVFTPSTDNAHYVTEDGVMREVWGCFHGTVSYTTSTGFLVMSGFPANGSRAAALHVDATLPLPASMATRPAVCEMNATQAAGVCYDTAGGNFTIAKITSGSTIRFHYRGRYSTV